MSCVHQLTITGNITRDPEMRYTPNGNAVLDVNVAVNRGFQQDGEWKDKAFFYKCTFWGQQAEKMNERNLHRGDLVFVQGEPMEPRIYEKRDHTQGIELGIDWAKIVLLKSAHPKQGDFEAAETEEPAEVGRDKEGDLI
jgi:single-strand DNA-binding protein